MRIKHFEALKEHCDTTAALSECPRASVGAIVFDEHRNLILLHGYNGGPQGGKGPLCGGNMCERTALGIKSGTEVQIGCMHAEMNVICHAAKIGVALEGKGILIDSMPCLMCAKFIHHAGINLVIYGTGKHTNIEGLRYLDSVNIANFTYEDYSIEFFGTLVAE